MSCRLTVSRVRRSPFALPAFSACSCKRSLSRMHIWVPKKDTRLSISQGWVRTRRVANKTVACSGMDWKAWSAAFELCEQGADDGHGETAVQPSSSCLTATGCRNTRCFRKAFWLQGMTVHGAVLPWAGGEQARLSSTLSPWGDEARLHFQHALGLLSYCASSGR